MPPLAFFCLSLIFLLVTGVELAIGIYYQILPVDLSPLALLAFPFL